MTVREIGIFGSSGHAREVADIAITLGYRPIFIAQNKRSAENISESDIILESEINKYSYIYRKLPSHFVLINFIILNYH